MWSYIQSLTNNGFNDAITSCIIKKCENFQSHEIAKDMVKLLYKNQIKTKTTNVYDPFLLWFFLLLLSSRNREKRETFSLEN